MELDEYINLESRVSGRMVLLDVSATGEEKVIDVSNQEMNDLSYRAKQLKELQTQVVDLEDCDYLVNYDIHWNPVRIIQRFGRVDRLGSKNDKIRLVNFWANMELDEYINLESRVSGRMFFQFLFVNNFCFLIFYEIS